MIRPTVTINAMRVHIDKHQNKVQAPFSIYGMMNILAYIDILEAKLALIGDKELEKALKKAQEQVNGKDDKLGERPAEGSL